jgi:hypothetical protein
MSLRIALAVAAATLVSALALDALQPLAGAAPKSPAGAGKIEPRKGTYRGRTEQRAVASSARAIELDVNRKRTRIELIVEPTVARDFCIASPVFVLDGVPVSARLKRGRFGFSRTFVGSRFDRITGRFVSPEEIEGEAVYNFAGSDAGLCSPGATKVRFSAKRR